MTFITEVDILYTSSDGKFVFTNKEGRVENVFCNFASNCSKSLMNISREAKNIVIYRSTYNFTQYPIDSVSHYTKNTIYISIVLNLILIVFIVLNIFIGKNLENLTFYL